MEISLEKMIKGGKTVGKIALRVIGAILVTYAIAQTARPSQQEEQTTPHVQESRFKATFKYAIYTPDGKFTKAHMFTQGENTYFRTPEGRIYPLDQIARHP